MKDLKKEAGALYSLLSDILDCDYRRLVDAIDDVDGDILSEAICEAKEYGTLTLNSIMRSVITKGIQNCRNDFYSKSKTLQKTSDEQIAERLEEFDIDILADSIRYEDGVTFSDIFGGYDNDDMKFYLKNFSDEFENLQSLIGNIDGLPN